NGSNALRRVDASPPAPEFESRARPDGRHDGAEHRPPGDAARRPRRLIPKGIFHRRNSILNYSITSAHVDYNRDTSFHPSSSPKLAACKTCSYRILQSTWRLLLKSVIKETGFRTMGFDERAPIASHSRP